MALSHTLSTTTATPITYTIREVPSEVAPDWVPRLDKHVRVDVARREDLSLVRAHRVSRCEGLKRVQAADRGTQVTEQKGRFPKRSGSPPVGTFGRRSSNLSATGPKIIEANIIPIMREERCELRYRQSEIFVNNGGGRGESGDCAFTPACEISVKRWLQVDSS